MAASNFSESQLRRLTNGEVLVSVQKTGDPPKGRVEAVILIQADSENIWRIMNDCQDIPNFIPGLVSCHILESGPDWDVIQHEVKWIWFFPKISYVFRAEYDPNRRIEFTRIRGDLRAMEGAWRLDPLAQNNQTIVTYSVFLDLGFFVPQWLVRRSLKVNLPEVLTALRQKVMDNSIEAP